MIRTPTLWTPERERASRARKARSRRGFLAMGWFCCCGCNLDCPICCNGPDQVQVDTSAWFNDAFNDCLDCDSYNGTFVLDWSGSSSECKWNFDFVDDPCSFGGYELLLFLSAGNVFVTLETYGGELAFGTNLGALSVPTDCSALFPITVFTAGAISNPCRATEAGGFAELTIP